MKRKIVISLLLSLTCTFFSHAQGLKFSGMEKTIEERTSLSVFDSKKPTFYGRLDISFDLITYPSSKFGYILRLYDRKLPSRVWNLSYDGRGEDIIIRLNEEGRRSLILAEFDKSDLPDYVWTSCGLSFDCLHDRLTLKIGDKTVSNGFTHEFQAMSPVLYFGLSEHVVDVPSFAIRNLTIGDEKKTLVMPLDEPKGNSVHNSSGVRYGHVENPEWIVNDAACWKHLGTMSSETAAGAVYDPSRKSICLFNGNQIQKFRLTTETRDVIAYDEPCPMNLLLGTCYLKDDHIVAYELNDWKNGPTGTSVAAFDLQTRQWTSLSEDRLDGPMHHHGAFYDKYSDEYVFFGGFGNLYYNGDFYALGNDNEWHKKWEDIERESLFPRFFDAIGLDEDGDHAYIFGGMGNESGEQVIGRQYFYDLHRVDLKTGECELLWDLEWNAEDVVPARNLIVDGDHFYALCYPEHLTNSVMHLYRFSIADGSYEVLADGIDVVSDKIWCSASLYLDRSMGRMIVTTMDVDNDFSTRLDMYSLAYPPHAPTKSRSSWQMPLILGATTLIWIAAICAAVVFVRRRTVNRRQQKMAYINARTDHSKRPYIQAKRNSSLLLFGDFQAIDRDGNDISNNFSNQHKLLLLLLVKNSTRNGLSSSRINSIMWPDKSEEKVKNSRGVAINGLRKNLSHMDGFSISFEEGVFRLIVEQPGYCDLFSLISAMESGDNDEVCRCASRGRFLMGVNDPLFDSFKGEIEGKVVPLLDEEMSRRFEAGEFAAVIAISDMAFVYDPLDENALHYAVNSLRAIKKHDEALVRYATFTNEYQKENGLPYPIKFEKI